MKQASNIFGASHNCFFPPSDNSLAFSGKPQMAAGTVQFSGAKFHMESPSQMHWSNAINVFLICPIICKHAKCADVPDVQNLTRCAKCAARCVQNVQKVQNVFDHGRSAIHHRLWPDIVTSLPHQECASTDMFLSVRPALACTLYMTL